MCHRPGALENLRRIALQAKRQVRDTIDSAFVLRARAFTQLASGINFNMQGSTGHLLDFLGPGPHEQPVHGMFRRREVRKL